jgi:hypothetical protein
MPALRRLRLRDGEFEASLGYTVKPSLSKKKKKKAYLRTIFMTVLFDL